MLIQDQYLYQSRTIDMSSATADYDSPDWGSLVDFFAIWVWKIAGMAVGFNLQP